MDLIWITGLILFLFKIAFCYNEDSNENQTDQSQTMLSIGKNITTSTNSEVAITNTNIPIHESTVSLEPSTSTSTSTLSMKTSLLSSTDSTSHLSTRCMVMTFQEQILIKYKNIDEDDKILELNSNQTNLNNNLSQKIHCNDKYSNGTKSSLIINNFDKKSVFTMQYYEQDDKLFLENFHFEIPISSLPNDYPLPESPEILPTCNINNKDRSSHKINENEESVVSLSLDKCLVASDHNTPIIIGVKASATKWLCVPSQVIKLSTGRTNESVEIYLDKFGVALFFNLTDSVPIGQCPSTLALASLNQTDLLQGISYAMAGALVMISVILVYEKVIRKKINGDYTAVKKEPTNDHITI